MDREFRILSIDGGGIRGVIPAEIFSKIESEVNAPIYEYFDLICGTSTGAIIALALATGKPALEIIEMYTSNAESIFPKKKQTLFLMTRVVFGRGFIYDSAPLKKILTEFYRKDNDILRMKDALVRLCIPTIDITGGRVKVYKTPHKVIKPAEKILIDDMNKKLYEISLTSSAAPVFFRPYKMESSYYVDGGLWGNNPSLVGITEAVRIGYDLKHIKLLSLGTGSAVYQIDENKARKMNVWNWGGGKKLVQLSFEVQSEAVVNQMNCILDENQYLRLDQKINPPIALDDTSRLNDLLAHAANLYRDKRHDIINMFFKNKSANPSYREESQ